MPKLCKGIMPNLELEGVGFIIAIGVMLNKAGIGSLMLSILINMVMLVVLCEENKALISSRSLRSSRLGPSWQPVARPYAPS